MENRPRLLLYGIAWNEQRNIIFSHYLSRYFTVFVLTRDGINKRVLELAKPTSIFFERFRIKNKIGLSFSFKLRNYLELVKPDYILTQETHSFSSYQAVNLAAKYNFKSVVFEWENVQSIPKHFFQKKIQREVVSKSSFLVAGSNDAKRYLLEKGGNADKIFINPETGIDTRIFCEGDDSYRTAWGFSKSDFIVLFAGRLIKEKGIELILEVAQKFESEYKDIKFVFVGKGFLTDKIRNFDAKNVFLKGTYDFIDMGKVFRSCDLFVYPSISTKYWVEQFGYSVIEAQACGKPVIVSDSGTLPKLVKDEISGSIIREKSELELKTKIVEWFNKSKNNKKISDNFVHMFNAQNISENYRKIILKNDIAFLENWF